MSSLFAELHQSVWSAWALRRYRERFDEVSTFCLFVGYPRSGHSLVGATLNAHRHAVMAHELQVGALVLAGCDRDTLYARILARAAWFHLRGNTSNYRYQVPNQWQGRFERLQVVGDKFGGLAAQAIDEHAGFLDRLAAIVRVPLRFVHVVRNPFDNIAAIALWHRLSIDDAVEYYFRLCRTTATLATPERSDTLTLHHEEWIRSPQAQLERLCAFLHLETDARYLEDCAGVTAESPSFTRRRVPWSAAQEAEVARRAAELPFLVHYTFEIPGDGAERRNRPARVAPRGTLWSRAVLRWSPTERRPRALSGPGVDAGPDARTLSRSPVDDTRLDRLVRKTRGNLVVLRHLPGQRRVPYLPEERWAALRDARVRAIVRHAAATVPHYRDLFRAERIDPREIRTAADLERLPLLDKGTVWLAPDRFLSESFDATTALPLVTSGSTGKPLTVLHDHASLVANIAYGEREREVFARLCGRGGRWREALLLYSGSTFGKVLSFYQQATFIPVRPDRLFVSIVDPIERVVDSLDRFRPDVLIGYASYLEMLFRTVAARELPMHRPRLVIYGGEALSAPGRELIAERFELPLTSLYNAVEAFKIGYACEAGVDYHLHADLTHVRIIDGQGRDAAEEERGEVVLSNLVNRATVLLNYRMGDVAARTKRRCACGRTLPLLTGLEGRVEDILVLPGGGFVHPLAIWGVFKGKPEVLRYQLLQPALDRFELRLATTDETAYRHLLPGIVRELHALLGDSAQIEPSHHRELEAPPPGKFRAVISACRPGEP